MNKMILIISLLILFAGFDVSSGKIENNFIGSLTIEISGFRNNKGKVYIDVYNRASRRSYPKERGIVSRVLDIKHKKASLTINKMIYGTYVISVHHDENQNDKMDTNLVGIPEEGLGYSNNVRHAFGPPNFRKASFKIESSETYQKIRIKYF